MHETVFVLGRRFTLCAICVFTVECEDGKAQPQNHPSTHTIDDAKPQANASTSNAEGLSDDTLDAAFDAQLPPSSMGDGPLMVDAALDSPDSSVEPTPSDSTFGDSGIALAETTWSSNLDSRTSTSDVPPVTPLPVRNYLPCPVERIVEERCRVCHSTDGLGEEPLLESWAQVASQSDIVLEAVMDDFMPLLPPPLTPEQKEALREWVEGGSLPVPQTTAPDCNIGE
jgi:hypothetical protein